MEQDNKKQQEQATKLAKIFGWGTENTIWIKWWFEEGENRSSITLVMESNGIKYECGYCDSKEKINIILSYI